MLGAHIYLGIILTLTAGLQAFAQETSEPLIARLRSQQTESWQITCPDIRARHTAAVQLLSTLEKNIAYLHQLEQQVPLPTADISNLQIVIDGLAHRLESTYPSHWDQATNELTFFWNIELPPYRESIGNVVVERQRFHIDGVTPETLKWGSAIWAFAEAPHPIRWRAQGAGIEWRVALSATHICVDLQPLHVDGEIFVRSIFRHKNLTAIIDPNFEISDRGRPYPFYLELWP